ncbi:hypothetical protein PR202_ga08987 [Eleusine coracana subsp. coracana]|uniref:CBM20 domain-containing protein n=1 Tax=Eleusine coracana subsp. coracana TaxID=191504 RepID=A0AAV5C3L7_ELECO|nr:hypothetical protein QOZ80_1AG0040460 [Eleusine coracana subsp. coracana]GJM92510.1 hypothetical protein PR202_ga08987 [Eleusine coracana subsp. coracana]
MEAAIVARRAGLFVPSRPGSSWPRARTRGHGTGVGYSSTPSAARWRMLVASLGVRESLPAESLGEDAMATTEVNLAQSWSSIDLAQADEDAKESAEILPPADVPANKTVRVKFVLEKACAFGQQFLVVGDDPALGLWDPAKAIALDWSEGHVWTVKMDLPANKSIEFKFLMRDASGHVLWQHGANRTLQTNETQNTLIVHEDWDHGKNQRVSEEEELSFVAEDVTFSEDLAASSGAMLADELRSGTNLESNKSAVAADNSTSLHLHGEMEEVNEEKEPQFSLEKDQMILNDLHGKEDMAPHNGYYLSSSDDDAATNEDHAAMCEEDAGIVNRSTSIFENDLAWARKALQQLLRFLGFQIGTTRT